MKLDFDCPHCKKDITLDSEKMKVTNQPLTVDTATAQSQQIITTEVKAEPEIKEVIKEVVKIPSHIPKFKCKNGDCGKMHENEDYTSKITAKCENCGQFTANTSDPCPFCNKTDYEDLDEDELNDLGIPQPNEGDKHSHSAE